MEFNTCARAHTGREAQTYTHVRACVGVYIHENDFKVMLIIMTTTYMVIVIPRDKIKMNDKRKKNNNGITIIPE